MAENKSTTLYQALWNSADILRSKMDANEYKRYLLGLVFYKYLSDKMLLHAA
ncbi:type I restriction-modification system subunit M N-terminal domain-containing protein [Oceanobacillus bengalensis]|uniref:type I restriction-modification system subunit M N-terminal domain-containing protein n=1 Tax=Oceanobacillus bengalensis TaxID=1435466 RepID=UPI001C7D9D23|nr:type I restriction-modification system subunit M N-terminal domain-containing protein [Oceanobacillus bengalensis]